MGGFALKTLKKLNGDKLGRPSELMVLANAIGLGATALNKRPCNLGTEMSLGSIEVMFTFLGTNLANMNGKKKQIY